MIDCLLYVALADGQAHPRELAMLESAAEALKLKPGAWRRLKAAHLGQDQDDPYIAAVSMSAPWNACLPGFPQDTWPWIYIDPDTCIDCGAWVPECPFAAIFPEDEVPSAYTVKGGEYISNVGLTGHYEATNHHGKAIAIETTRQLAAGEVLDFTPDIQPNYEFFKSGPGYSVKDVDDGT